MSGLQSKLSVENIDVKNKRVLLRVDFNVPLDKKTFKVGARRERRLGADAFCCAARGSEAAAGQRPEAHPGRHPYHSPSSQAR
jgi:hypothetical protein